MVRAFGLATLLTMTALYGAFAEDLGAAMGIYEGQYTSGAWNAKPCTVQVVAMGKRDGKVTYRAVFPLAAPQSRVAVMGATQGAATHFEGAVQLGGELGQCDVTIDIAGEAMKGLLKGKKESIAFEANRVVKTPPSLGAKPPEGAVVLVDGTNLDAWQRVPLVWNMVEEGAMEVCGSSLATKQEFGDCEMHIEFRTPFMPDQSDQGRGNSGVYVLGRYEVQVLDSFGVEPADNLCGGIYQAAKPLVDACLPPLQWQTYDITFTTPKFDASGKKIQNARITVLHNGLKIHDNLELKNATPGGLSDKEATAGPLMLQDHGNAVRYRNIWILQKK